MPSSSVQYTGPRGYDKVGRMIENNLPHLFNYQAFPRSQWIKLRITNPLKNINSLIKRRTRPIGAFPSNQSVLRVIVNILMDVNEEFATANKHGPYSRRLYKG